MLCKHRLSLSVNVCGLPGGQPCAPVLSGPGEVLLIHRGWCWDTNGSGAARPAGSAVGDSSGLLVKRREVLNMLTMVGAGGSIHEVSQTATLHAAR